MSAVPSRLRGEQLTLAYGNKIHRRVAERDHP